MRYKLSSAHGMTQYYNSSHAWVQVQEYTGYLVPPERTISLVPIYALFMGKDVSKGYVAVKGGGS